METRGWVALLLVALFGTPTAAKDFESKDKKFRLTISDAWRPADIGDTDERFVIRLRFKVPGEGSGHCTVDHLPSGPMVERAQAFIDMEAPRWTKNRKAKVVQDPAVHLVSDDGKGRFAAIFYRSIRGNMFSVIFRISAGMYNLHLDELVAITTTLVADLPTKPPIPTGYKKKKAGGFLWLHHKTVDGKCKTLRRELASPRHALPQIIVLTDFVQKRDVGAEMIDWDFQADTDAIRLFCKPLGKEPEPRQLYRFHRELHALLFDLTYGFHDPRWLSLGLQSVETSYTLCGRKLPALAEDHFNDLPGRNLTFEAMLALEDYGTYRKNGFCYTVLFLSGPKKYREAFKAFLTDLRATGDWRNAQKTHLLALDQTEMQADAQKVMRKLKSTRAK